MCTFSLTLKVARIIAAHRPLSTAGTITVDQSVAYSPGDVVGVNTTTGTTSWPPPPALGLLYPRPPHPASGLSAM